MRVGEWLERFARDGFDGVELWENHAALASEQEILALERSPIPISIFNSYADTDDAEAPARQAAVQFVQRFKSRGLKYNVGKDAARREEYLRNARAWREALGPRIRFLCECHPGTIVEEAGAARRFFDELGGDGYEIIVHPFNRLETLDEWFEQFGPRIAHAHLQMRDESSAMARFDDYSGRARDAIRRMRAHGYAGTYTLEFAAGTRDPDENPETLYQNALRDFEFLKEILQ
ncbi:MAG: hypothetical protein BWZ10_03237 [candidate division BRC1 bacterium ADurb.BinA364]|nr:MAG: hypothetical protein BWZ10_03237 [candidate division BRC1 bacterium ADurb.BinA364]